MVVVVVVGSCDIGEVQWRKGRWQGVVGRRCRLHDLVMRRVGRDQWVKWAERIVIDRGKGQGQCMVSRAGSVNELGVRPCIFAVDIRRRVVVDNFVAWGGRR